ncbi:hypothetical protein AAZV13_11G124850 [Glycine max]
MAMSQSACKETGMKSCSLVENFLVHLLRRILRDRALYKVTSDFVDAAINGAIGVISGCIPPINLTDPECFHMYVHNNIFFSFAIDADLEKLSKKLVDANSKSWSSSSLQSSSDKDSIPVHGESQVLWPECGWQPVSLTDMITSSAVKKVYRKANLCIHPDKVQQKGATLEQKYTAEKVFDILKEAYTKFNAEELS